MVVLSLKLFLLRRRKMSRFLSSKEIEKGGFMPTSVARAKTLKVVRQYETARHVAYEVTDPKSGSRHVVFYKKQKEPPLDWVCDCEWYTTRTIHSGKYCAHILAVHLKFKEA